LFSIVFVFHVPAHALTIIASSSEKTASCWLGVRFQNSEAKRIFSSTKN
jgi:hypothetical protein